MKTLTLCMTLILSGTLATASEIDNILLIKENSGAGQILHFGLDPAATDTLDAGLGENELPPFPPTGVFEARFIGDDIFLPRLGQGTYKDFRQGDATFADTVLHELKYQLGSGTEITVIWKLSENITGLLQDLFGGVVINKEMKESDSLIVTNPGAINKLKMIIYYSGIPLSPELVSPDDSTTGIARDTVLTWRNSAGASAYAVQVSESCDFAMPEVEYAGPDTSLQLSNLKHGTTYFWRVNAQNANGIGKWSDVWQFTTAKETNVKQNDAALNLQYHLFQNYPNPFNPTTTIQYQLPVITNIQIIVYDINGRKIKTLYDGKQTAGQHYVVWDGLNDEAAQVASGTCIIRFIAPGFTQSSKILLLR